MRKRMILMATLSLVPAVSSLGVVAYVLLNMDEIGKPVTAGLIGASATVVAWSLSILRSVWICRLGRIGAARLVIPLAIVTLVGLTSAAYSGATPEWLASSAEGDHMASNSSADRPVGSSPVASESTSATPAAPVPSTPTSTPATTTAPTPEPVQQPDAIELAYHQLAAGYEDCGNTTIPISLELFRPLATLYGLEGAVGYVAHGGWDRRSPLCE